MKLFFIVFAVSLAMYHGLPNKKEGIIREPANDCFTCILENAPQCIPKCIRNPTSKECLDCLTEFAAKCIPICTGGGK